MKFIEITGTDTDLVGEELQAAACGTVERFDAATDHGRAAASSATTPTLFATDRTIILDNADKVTVAYARQLADSTTNVTVIFTGDKQLTAPVRKALPGIERHLHPLPTVKTADQWVRDTASSAGVTLPADWIRRLGVLATDQVAAHRIRQAQRLFAGAGTHTPTTEQLDAFLGDLTGDTPFWALGDAISRGDKAAVISIGLDDPIPALTIATTRLARICAALEQAADDLPKLLGLSPAAARMLLHGFKGTPERANQAFQTLIEAELNARTLTDPELVRASALTACVTAAELLNGDS